MVSVRDINFSGGQLLLEVDVTNPNSFPIGVDALGYIIRLGNTELGRVEATAPADIAALSEGRVTLSAGVAASTAAVKLMQGASLDTVDVKPTGRIRTPYGPIGLETAEGRVRGRRSRG